MSFSTNVAVVAILFFNILLSIGMGYYWGLYTALKMAIQGKYGDMHIKVTEVRKNEPKK